jgi:hypothetical protein
MERTRVGVAAFVIVSALLTVPLHAQATYGVDLDVFSSYVWRGLTLTNKPVAQPAVWVSFPAGSASITVGGWSSIDLGKYDDPEDDISESGGTSAFNFAEFDPYAEVGYTVGKATLTGGVTAYIYPNDFGFTKDLNTVEIYGKAGLDVPLSPQLSIYYDVDKVKGAYLEGSISHSLPASEKVSIDLGATAGFSAGQDADFDALGVPQSEFFNFADNGFTHLDISAGVPFSAGAISITPVLHLVITGDDFTKVTSPSNIDTGAKVWGGLSFSWSNDSGEEEEAPASPE